MTSTFLGDLWITNHYMKHNWLCPSLENVLIWPHTSLDTQDTSICFVSDHIQNVINKILYELKHVTFNDTHCTKVTIQNELIPDYAMNVRVFNSLNDIKSILNATSVVYVNISSPTNVKYFVCIEVRTIRFDKDEHLILGVSHDFKPIWNVWTIEESFLQICKVNSTLSIKLTNTIFLFNRNASMLNTQMKINIKNRLSHLFYWLPEDIIIIIADFVHNDTISVSKRFFAKQSLPTFNYAVARLLCIHNLKVKSKDKDTTLQKYYENPQDKNYEKIIKRTLREISYTFDRKPYNKTLRSGLIY